MNTREYIQYSRWRAETRYVAVIIRYWRSRRHLIQYPSTTLKHKQSMNNTGLANGCKRKADMDQATKEGLLTVIERFSLLDEIKAAIDPKKAREELTIESDKVQERILATQLELAKYRPLQH